MNDIGQVHRTCARLLLFDFIFLGLFFGLLFTTSSLYRFTVKHIGVLNKPICKVLLSAIALVLQADRPELVEVTAVAVRVRRLEEDHQVLLLEFNNLLWRALVSQEKSDLAAHLDNHTSESLLLHLFTLLR